MRPAAFNFVLDCKARFGTPARIVEIGSRDVNGGVRRLFPASAYVGVDIRPGRGVDVVCDGATYVPDTPPDWVICCETLEHADRAEQIVFNAWTMLRPGGRLIVTAATDPCNPHSAIDGGSLRPGEYYRNVSKEELEMWLAPFIGWYTRVDGDDLQAAARKASD